MGGKVEVRSTLFLPWTGLVLRGISVPDPDSPQNHIFEAESVRANFAITPLFRHQLVVTDITIYSPTVLANQAKSGSWVFSIAPPKPASAAQEATIEPAASPAPEPLKPRPPAFSVEVQVIHIRHANTTFLDAKGQPLLTLSDINIDARSRARKPRGEPSTSPRSTSPIGSFPRTSPGILSGVARAWTSRISRPSSPPAVWLENIISMSAATPISRSMRWWTARN